MQADQLLAVHFREDMGRIVEHCGHKVPSGRQTVLVSATLTPRVLSQFQGWCPDPVRLFVGEPMQAADEGQGPAPGSGLWGWNTAATPGEYQS